MPWSRELGGPEDTAALGHELALVARPGTAILLSGGLGAGKTTLARAVIEALSDGAPVEVPSPTFTLVQTYDGTRIPVAHADLYRLAGARDAEELGLDDLAKTHLVMVEWPDRLDGPLAASRLSVHLNGAGPGRRARLEAEGGWVQALARLDTIRDFLSRTEWAGATRRFLEGDASFRRYERLDLDGRQAILMDMPARPDGPPVKDGKPYSRIAHLAEDIRAVAAVNGHLASLGYSAPRLYASDLPNGLAVIEDLGDRLYGRMMQAGADMREPQAAAVGLLTDMAAREWPSAVVIPGGGTHAIPAYDRGAMVIETELLTDWFWPYRLGRPIPASARDGFAEGWSSVLPLVEREPPVWTLRDFHSPNLLWLPEREGIGRVGLIDTQDCVLGHPAYDLAALLQDARVTVDPSTADHLLDRYCASRRGFDEQGFRAAFAVLGAQRATKVLGIFARLHSRDGKPGYLQHMPRVSRYLERNLAHPALAPLKHWFDAHLPANVREGEQWR